MAESRRRFAWRIAATVSCTIGNSFRTKQNALKFTSFPYCSTSGTKSSSTENLKAHRVNKLAFVEGLEKLGWKVEINDT